MKKVLLAVLVVFSMLMLTNANAVINSCTLNLPVTNEFDAGLRIFNVTAVWANTTTEAVNVTNVTFNIGTTRFVNSTVNGSQTNTSGAIQGAAAGVAAGDFTFGVDTTTIANGNYTAFATCYNNTDRNAVNVAVNSSSITYTVDNAAPSIAIGPPYAGSSVLPNSKGIVTFVYNPSDSNLGNCSLNLNNNVEKTSITTSTTANATQNYPNTFTKEFPVANNSVRVAITCNDLAGNNGVSQNFTFNVMIGNIPYAIRQASGGGGSYAQSPTQPSAAGSGFSATNPPSVNVQTHLQQYGWIYFVLAVVIVLGLIIRKLYK